MTRLGILVSHPIQYYSPLFRELTKRMDLHVFYGQLADHTQQAFAGFGVEFDWDVDLISGYSSSILHNRSAVPDVSTFKGCDVPTMRADLAAQNLDALLVVGWYQKAFIQGIIAANRLGIPVMVRGDSQLGMPGNALKRLAKLALYPALLRTVDAALYVGQHSRAYYEHFRYPEERLFFSPHCIDTQRFATNATEKARLARRAALRVSPETPLILFAGKLVPFKRPLDVIRAAARLRADGSTVEVMIAGAGQLQDELNAEASKLGVPLHCLGFCNQSVMPSVYAAADVLALPSTGRETWGLVCNEALASGTPVVISDECGCAPDLTADGTVGRSFLGGDVEGLTKALDATLSAPPGKEAIRAVSDAHSVGRAADGIEAAMAYCVRRSAGGRQAGNRSHD